MIHKTVASQSDARIRNSAIALPSLHPAGSVRLLLRRDHLAALKAVSQAIEVMGRTYPEERDYYPQGRDAIGRAREEHRLRLARLKTVFDEIRVLVEHIG